ncbi:CotH kinase family protein [Paenibacillus sp. YPG26]|uniref:CotH kinase family protein n=1 Tax=Paenibacillus sp. YPG26 TaxID=2878915 RepID=UPI00203FD396|nr:CotH kinase family protein [Paenibacillus sp. YPG26]USB34863.1 CotH kinase family protein [Paenibacillus sp. YPG26]
MGLPVYRIGMKKADITQLNQNIWSKEFVRGEFSMKGISRPARIRFRGEHTREYPKRSFEIRTRGRTYHFNAQYDDPSMLRNALSFQFFEAIGVPAPAAQHCVLVMNGELLGVYLRLEAVKTSFFRTRAIPARSIFYAVNDNADFSLFDKDNGLLKESLFSGYSLIKGWKKDRQRLEQFVHLLNAKQGNELLSFLQRRINIDNYLRWLCGAVMTGNDDGLRQNYTWYEHKTTGKYGIVPWDYEGTWGRNFYGARTDSNVIEIQGDNQLTGKMLSFRPLRAEYKRLLRSFLTKDFRTAIIMGAARRMHSRITADAGRDPNTKWAMSDFHGELGVIREYTEERREYLIQHLKDL